MTQVNLLPSDVKQKARTRQATVLVGVVVGIIVAALIGLFMLENKKLASAQDDLAQANATNAALTQKVSSLQRFQTLADEQAAKKQTINQLKSGSVAFSAVLVDLSRAIPSTAYLTSMTGTLTATVAARASAPPTSGIVGNIQWGGQAQTHDDVALWLTRLTQITGWNNSWISGSTEQGTSTWVQFTGSVDLGQKVTTGGK